MKVHHEGHLQLGANSIYARNQYRIAKLLFVDGKQSAKPANIAYYPFGKRPVGKVLDASLGPVSSVNIDAAIGIGNGSILQL
jgi:hypothetical protein